MLITILFLVILRGDIMNKLELIYEGKAKKVFAYDESNKVIIEFKDEATAFNALKKANSKVKES